MRCWRINAFVPESSAAKEAHRLPSPVEPSPSPTEGRRRRSSSASSPSGPDLPLAKQTVVAQEVEPRRRGVRPKPGTPDALDLGYKQRK
jgi:hypothetical protein